MSAQSVSLSYSGYTQGLFPLIESKEEKEEDSVAITFNISVTFRGIITQAMMEFSSMDLVSINGLSGRVASLSPSKEDRKQLQMSVKIDKVASETLKLVKDSPVSVGIRSTDNEKWLLSGESQGTVLLDAIEEGIYLTFNCSPEQIAMIKDLDYLGLNGSAFKIQSRTENSFSVVVEKETEENTIFNVKQIDVGSECVLTLPIEK